jgi:acyl-homoserine-lactone acylase
MHACCHVDIQQNALILLNVNRRADSMACPFLNSWILKPDTLRPPARDSRMVGPVYVLAITACGTASIFGPLLPPRRARHRGLIKCISTFPGARMPSKAARFLIASAAFLFAAALCAQSAYQPTAAELARWQNEAAAVTIVRDDWGIAHIHGHTDAEAVFGMEFAQAEDDFNRVETNYLNSLGRLAEAEGEQRVIVDLRQKLFMDPVDLKEKYNQSPAWLKALMDAFADGLNFYLYKHPEVHPRVITHFEPWMALSFTEGSIGGDIERIHLDSLEAFYSKSPSAYLHSVPPGAPGAGSPTTGLRRWGGGPSPLGTGEVTKPNPPGAPGLAFETWETTNHPRLAQNIDADPDFTEPGAPGLAFETWETTNHPHLAQNIDTDPDFAEPVGSNGMAIAPANTIDHHALLLINPHTSFFFRSELQMSSDEGLDAYGAVTWGQFFVYQGFNPHVGWMHTSSNVDAIDEYLETVSQKDGMWFYKFGTEERPVTTRTIVVPYKTPTGMEQKTFTAFFTQHGPIIRTETQAGQTRWVAIRLMQRPIEALEQSYLRTKTSDYKSYWKTMELYANSSNNTIFADGDGDIAYFHGNYIPRRDTRFDWTKPVDGSDPATEYKGLLTVDETPHLLNPHVGWLYNSNNWPWSAAGPDSPKRQDYPVYVEQGTESARGLHAIRVLSNKKDFTVDSLIAAAYDSYLPWFAPTIPALIRAYDALPGSDPRKAKLAPAIETLRKWDLRWASDSVATSLAVFWGQEVSRPALHANRGDQMVQDWIAEHATAAEMLAALDAAVGRLTADFGSWQTPWGQINRYQRINDDIVPSFSDSAPSIPVPFTSSFWGSLASFGARPYPNTKKWYGTSGNSFVAVVEFGPRIRARAVTCGGESGNPGSKHFNDEAERYSSGNLRDVYFYPDQLTGHTERTYHPGE